MTLNIVEESSQTSSERRKEALATFASEAIKQDRDALRERMVNDLARPWERIEASYLSAMELVCDSLFNKKSVESWNIQHHQSKEDVYTLFRSEGLASLEPGGAIEGRVKTRLHSDGLVEIDVVYPDNMRIGAHETLMRQEVEHRLKTLAEYMAGDVILRLECTLGNFTNKPKDLSGFLK